MSLIPLSYLREFPIDYPIFRLLATQTNVSGFSMYSLIFNGDKLIANQLNWSSMAFGLHLYTSLRDRQCMVEGMEWNFIPVHSDSIQSPCMPNLFHNWECTGNCKRSRVSGTLLCKYTKHISHIHPYQMQHSCYLYRCYSNHCCLHYHLYGSIPFSHFI